jgi:hypothetical protein
MVELRDKSGSTEFPVLRLQEALCQSRTIGRVCMAHRTLQEVVDRINQIYFSMEDRQPAYDHAATQKHRPEFYIPRITRYLARFIFSTGPVQLRGRV